MKKLTIILFLTFASLQVFSQTKIDSVKIKESDMVSTNDDQINFARKKANEVNEINSSGASSHIALNDIFNGNSAVRTYDLRYEGVKGSPFFIERWSTGYIEFANGTIGKANLKYDALAKNLIMLRKAKGDSLELYPYQLNAFALIDESTNNSYVFRKFPNVKTELGTLPTAYLQVLSEGKTVNFLKLSSKRKIAADYKGGYGNDKRFDTFTDNSELYVNMVNDAKVIRIKKNKKSLVAALVNKELEIEEFIEKNKLKLKDETEIAKVIEYYNSL